MNTPDSFSLAAITAWLVQVSGFLEATLGVVAMLVALTAGIVSLYMNWNKIRDLRRAKKRSSK